MVALFGPLWVPCLILCVFGLALLIIELMLPGFGVPSRTSCGHRHRVFDGVRYDCVYRGSRSRRDTDLDDRFVYAFYEGRTAVPFSDCIKG